MNHGSSFTFSFQAPLATSYVQETNTGPESARPIIRLEGRRILLVDDSVDNRRLVSRILRIAGAEIEVTEDGRTAIAAIVLAGSQRRANSEKVFFIADDELILCSPGSENVNKEVDIYHEIHVSQ